MLNYGFIVENNDGNEYPFHLELDKSDPMFSVKREFLNGQINKTFVIHEIVNESNVMDFFSFLRFKFFEGSEYELSQVNIDLFRLFWKINTTMRILNSCRSLRYRLKMK